MNNNLYQRGIEEGVDAITVKFVIEAIDEYWRKQEPSVYALDKRLDLSVSTLEHKIDLLDKKIDAVEERLTLRIDGLDKRIDGLDKKIDAVEERLSKKIDSNTKLLLNMIGIVGGIVSALMICGFGVIGWLIKG